MARFACIVLLGLFAALLLGATGCQAEEGPAERDVHIGD